MGYRTDNKRKEITKFSFADILNTMHVFFIDFIAFTFYSYKISMVVSLNYLWQRQGRGCIRRGSAVAQLLDLTIFRKIRIISSVTVDIIYIYIHTIF
jgi:hypothetical protein